MPPAPFRPAVDAARDPTIVPRPDGREATMALLYLSRQTDGEEWRALLTAELPGLDFRTPGEAGDPAEIDAGARLAPSARGNSRATRT